MRKSRTCYLLDISLIGNRGEVQNLIYDDRQSRQGPRFTAELPTLH